MKYFIIIIGLSFICFLLLGGFSEVDDNKINNADPLVFAHRGITTYYSENSVESFQKALDFGFNAIETDVRRTKEGKLIIYHDESAECLLNINRNISDLTWDEIKNKNLSYNSNETKNKVLSLNQYLDWSNDSIITYLDMKELSKSIADSLLVLIAQHNKSKNIIVADQNIFFLSYLKRKNPHIRVVLEGFTYENQWIYHIIPKRMKPDYYAGFIGKNNESHISFLNKHDILEKKIVYGVNHDNISKAYQWGLSNIIYDYDSVTCNLKNMKRLLIKNRLLKESADRN